MLCLRRFFNEKIVPVEIGNNIITIPAEYIFFVLFPEDLLYGDNEPKTFSLFNAKDAYVISGEDKGMLIFTDKRIAYDFGFSLKETYPFLHLKGTSSMLNACLQPEEQSYIYSALLRKNLSLEREGASLEPLS